MKKFKGFAKAIEEAKKADPGATLKIEISVIRPRAFSGKMSEE